MQQSPKLNTHLVAWIGIAAVVLGSAADPNVQADILALAAALASGEPPSPARTFRIALRAVILIGAVACYVGRPQNVPSDKKPPQSPRP